MPDPRPTSPFLILLFGVAATALAAEWLRFGWSLAAAALPAALGTIGTIVGVARAYRARRRWRRRRALGPGAAPAEGVDAGDEAEIRLTHRPASAPAAPAEAPARPARAAPARPAAEAEAAPPETTRP